MRSRYGGYRKPRTKKIRPLVRVRERIAKKGGRCAGCRSRYEKGDEITVVIVKQRKYHRHTCVPANAGQMPTAGAPNGPIANTPDAVVKAFASNWTIGEAKLVAIQAFENAMVVVAKNSTITPEMEKAFDRFNKIKARVIRPGTDAEGQVAFRLAITEIAKNFF
jgi:hypothetical protein